MQSRRGLVPIGQQNMWALVLIGDLLLQGICYYRGFIAIGDLLLQGICQSRGLDPIGDLLEQGTGSYRAAKYIGIGSHRGFIQVGDLFKQGIGQSRGLILLQPLFRRHKAASNRLGSKIYILWKYKAYMGQQGVKT